MSSLSGAGRPKCPACGRPVYRRGARGPISRWCSDRCKARDKARRRAERLSPSEEYPRGDDLVAILGVWTPADGLDPD
jgi:endogenous inhibitor of DNA gyrase (YacG/DUF329 family)